MAYTSEIEKLERRWLENPKGRNFAPLADAYRKAGELDRAIDLCKSGLERHPDYVSAHIVYGRCLIDMKNDAGAQETFQKVLALDPENIIALKILSEIAERNNRFDEAVDWLARLLNADPMNGEAAEHLARAKTKASAAKPTAPMAQPDFVVEHIDVQPVTPVAAATPSPDVETFDGSLDFNAAAHSAAKAEGLEVQEDVELNSQQIEQVDVVGLARTQYEGSGMFKLDIPSPEVQPPIPELIDDAMPPVDLPLIMPDDMSAAQAPAPVPPRRPAPPPPPPPAPAIPAAVALSDDDGAADTATLSQAEPVLTETMAELYLKQGHQHDALRVYQALLAQRPSDARLRHKVEQLSGGGHTRHASGVSAQAFLKGIWSGRAAVPAPAPAPVPSRAPAPPPPPVPPPPPPPPPQSTLDGAFDAAIRPRITFRSTPCSVMMRCVARVVAPSGGAPARAAAHLRLRKRAAVKGQGASRSTISLVDRRPVARRARPPVQHPRRRRSQERGRERQAVRRGARSVRRRMKSKPTSSSSGSKDSSPSAHRRAERPQSESVGRA